MNKTIDFALFHNHLYQASKDAFVAIQRDRLGERFYLFALYTCGELGYFYPTASSEEGLTQVAQGHAENEKLSEFYSGFTVEDLREQVRWSPCDSPLHLYGKEYFTSVNEMARDIADLLMEIPIDDSWVEFRAFYDKVIGVCIRVLQQLDAEGVFGTGKQREEIVLNILMGDQSDDQRLKFAKLLNPRSVYKRFVRDYHV